MVQSPALVAESNRPDPARTPKEEVPEPRAGCEANSPKLNHRRGAHLVSLVHRTYSALKSVNCSESAAHGLRAIDANAPRRGGLRNNPDVSLVRGSPAASTSLDAGATSPGQVGLSDETRLGLRTQSQYFLLRAWRG